MRRIVILALGLCGWIVAALSAAQVPPQAKPAPTSIAPPTISIKSVVDTYCIACHNQKLRTAGLVLEGVDTTRPAANADVWERVIAKLRAGAMPPPGLPRPDAKAYDTAAGWLEDEIDRAWVAAPNPGRSSAVQRLNRTEYNNTI